MWSALPEGKWTREHGGLSVGVNVCCTDFTLITGYTERWCSGDERTWRSHYPIQLGRRPHQGRVSAKAAARSEQVFLTLENEGSDTDIDIDEYGKRASSFMSDDSYISEDFGCFSDFSDDELASGWLVAVGVRGAIVVTPIHSIASPWL